MGTIALAIIFRNVAENIWGRDDLKFPSPLPELPLSWHGVNVLPMELLIGIGALAIMCAIEFFNRRTFLGKAIVATADDRDAAELMGINTRRMISLSFGMSSMAAAFAGVLIAPVTLTGATMGSVLGLKAFAVAIIGGLSSGLGAIVGGIFLGIVETLTGYYISTGYKDVPGLVLLLIVLAVKPSGLFSTKMAKKV
jgi:branched-chain amino acid transport system permease protein